MPDPGLTWPPLAAPRRQCSDGIAGFGRSAGVLLASVRRLRLDKIVLASRGRNNGEKAPKTASLATWAFHAAEDFFRRAKFLFVLPFGMRITRCKGGFSACSEALA